MDEDKLLSSIKSALLENVPEKVCGWAAMFPANYNAPDMRVVSGLLRLCAVHDLASILIWLIEDAGLLHKTSLRYRVD